MAEKRRAASAPDGEPSAVRPRPDMHLYIAPFVLRSKAFLDRTPVDAAKRALARMSLEDAEAMVPLWRKAILTKERARVQQTMIGTWVFRDDERDRVGQIKKLNKELVCVSHGPNLECGEVLHCDVVTPQQSSAKMLELLDSIGKKVTFYDCWWHEDATLESVDHALGGHAFATVMHEGKESRHHVCNVHPYLGHRCWQEYGKAR